MDQRTKRGLWILAGAVVVVALVVHHNISTTDIVIFCAVVPSIILHEVSHGWVANAFGDDTAKRAGRLSLNPVRHVDPVGTLLVPALLALSTLGVFGWAKPVPVNTARLRSPRNQGVLVSLAGPFMNVLLAGLFGFLFVHFYKTGFISTGGLSVVAQFVFWASFVNVGLCAFNMIPVPPLDGSVLFERLLPARWWPTYLRYRQYTMPVLLALVVLNFFLSQNGHVGPLTWLIERLYNWWAQDVLHLPITFG
jgi:Zn-dependent protease